MSRKRPARRRMRAHGDLLATVAHLLRLLPALGAAVVGASAIGTVAGALYIQSYFESLHAGWAVDLVPYSVMLRTGLMGGATLVIALAGTLTMVMSGSLRERGLKMSFIGCLTATALLALLCQWSPTWLHAIGSIVDLVLLLTMCFSIALAVTGVIARRIARPRDRRRVLAAGSLLVGALVILPMQRGGLEADATLGLQATGLHPDICIKGDAARWRLIRAFDSQMLVTRLDTKAGGPSRLVKHDDVSAVLGPGSTLSCSTLASEAHR